MAFSSPIIDDGKGGYKLGEEKVLGYVPGMENYSTRWYECENGHKSESSDDPAWDYIDDWCGEWS